MLQQLRVTMQVLLGRCMTLQEPCKVPTQHTTTPRVLAEEQVTMPMASHLTTTSTASTGLMVRQAGSQVQPVLQVLLLLLALLLQLGPQQAWEPTQPLLLQQQQQGRWPPRQTCVRVRGVASPRTAAAAQASTAAAATAPAAATARTGHLGRPTMAASTAVTKAATSLAASHPQTTCSTWGPLAVLGPLLLLGLVLVVLQQAARHVESTRSLVRVWTSQGPAEASQ
jgi:hypothetical protein